MEELLKQELEKIYKDKKVTQLIEKDRKLYYLINEISKSIIWNWANILKKLDSNILENLERVLLNLIAYVEKSSVKNLTLLKQN